MPTSRSRVALWVALLILGPLSVAVRHVNHRRVTLVGNPSWTTTDSDSLYHVRRVDRALREGVVDGSDPYLNHPHGSAIPWPPYYTQFLALALGPFAPDASGTDATQSGSIGSGERRAWIERSVASAPMLLGALATLLAVLAGWYVAGGAGAFLAGGYHALSGASIEYTRSGNGDHHGWVAFLFAAALVILANGLRRGALERSRAGLVVGVLSGTTMGILLGSWVGALLYIIAFDLILAWLLFAEARSGAPKPGLAPLGLGFHGSALLALLPAVLASPWNQTHPWMVINLTWFHPLFLAVGAAVFAPLFWLPAQSPVRRRYPWWVAGALALVFALVALVPNPISSGVGEGFAWVSRADQFMARVKESGPLVGSGHWGLLFSMLGFGVLLMPFAWWALARAAAGGALALVPWAVCVPFLAVQAARQGRFADVLAVPLSVVLAFSFGRMLQRTTPRLPTLVAGVLGLFVAIALNPGSSGDTLERYRDRGEASFKRLRPAEVGGRGAVDWLRTKRGPALAGKLGPELDTEGVLAAWSFGHLIEWGADRPSIATNFGSYIGADSFADPYRFFMTEDLAEGLELLKRRRARWVLVPSNMLRTLNTMADVAVPANRSKYIRGPGADGSYSPALGWFRTLGARLWFAGEVIAPPGAPAPEPWAPLDFMRLVYVSQITDGSQPLPSGKGFLPTAFLWERVEGAVVEAAGSPGVRFEVKIPVRFPKSQYRFVWRAGAVAGADGIARLRVPYATDVPNGDGWVTPSDAKWSLGSRSGVLTVPDAAVLEGSTVSVR